MKEWLTALQVYTLPCRKYNQFSWWSFGGLRVEEKAIKRFSDISSWIYVQVFQWMQTIPQYRPDELVYRTIINVLVNARRMNVAETVFEEFVKSGMGPSHDDYVILMSGYTKCGSLQRGIGVLQKMRDAGIRPLVSAYNVLLDGCQRSIRGCSLYLSAIPMVVYVVVLFLYLRMLTWDDFCVVPMITVWRFSYRICIEIVMISRPGYGSSAERSDEAGECGSGSSNLLIYD
jgi:pentatricopeptide repeat protein